MEKGPFKAYPFSLHRSVLGNEGFTKNKIKWIDGFEPTVKESWVIRFGT